MENKVRIKRIVSWTFPFFGDRHMMPYGALEVTDGVDTKIVKTKGDTPDTFHIHNCQYVTFKRKAYMVCGTTSQVGTFNIWLVPIK